MVEQLAPDELHGDDPPAELRRGTRLGRYELLLPIAKGGMARVWAARLHGQRGFSKTVAIKTILPNLAQEPEFEKMFLDEARIAALVHHPNVCEIYELGEEGKILYLAMEWINGESLIHILRSPRGGPPNMATQPGPGTKIDPAHPHLCARIVSDAAAGLHAAHNLKDDDGQPMGVVHRDVSPHNIMITSDGNVKVTDFGVAKALGQLTNTRAGQVKGKMAYMAPEQIQGQGIDRRSDVFSLGVVLYEATTGKKPFLGQGDAQVMNAILSGEMIAPSRLVRGYPAELEQIVVRALARQPAARFPTAERMHLALEEFIVKSGSIVTQSHVATFVQQRLGAQLERRREKIRAAASAPAADDISASGSHAAPSGTPSARNVESVSGVQSSRTPEPISGAVSAPPARPAPRAEPQSSAMKYILAASIGVGVACALAVGGLLVVRKMHPDAPVQRVTPVVTTLGTRPSFPSVPTTAAQSVSALELDDVATPADAAPASATEPTLAPSGVSATNTKKPPALPPNPYGP